MSKSPLGQKPSDHFRLGYHNIRQAPGSAIMGIGKAFVIEAKGVQ